MKKELLQKIAGLCCFALNDKECIKLQKYLLVEEYASARIFLDKCINNTEWTLAFEPSDEELISQLKYTNELQDYVMELTIINEGDKRKESNVRDITK